MPALITLTTAGAALFGGVRLYGRYHRRSTKTLANTLQQRPTVIQNQEPSAFAAIRYQGRQWQQSLASSLTELDEEYQRFIKTRIDPLFLGKRHASMKANLGNDEEPEIIPYERQLNRKLGIAGVITVAALVTTPLSGAVQFVACVPLALYMIRDTYKYAYRVLKEERRLAIPVLMVTNQTLIWLGGYYLLGGALFILWMVGQKLGFITEVRSQEQLVNIFGELPQRVWILHEGVEIEIPFTQVQAGHVLIVGAGQMIPVDGVIVDGYASIDQHQLTGESQPVEKEVGDKVLAATVILAGRIHVQVEKAGQETVASQIGEMLSKTASYQMAITSKARLMADNSVKPTLVAAGLAGLLYGLPGTIAITSSTFGLNLLFSGPLALRNYLLVAARRSILVKDGRSLDLLTEIDTVVFDKTGTLTLEQPHVNHIHIFGDLDRFDVLRYAAAVEQRQSHPIARAILAHAEEQTISLPEIDDTRYEMGYGLRAQIEGKLIYVGSDRFMTLENISLPPAVEALQEKCHAQGHSLVMVAIKNQLVGAIELEPTIRPEAKAVINELRQHEIDFYIISGDQEGPTRKLAQTLGIENYFANTLPEDKAQLVEQLQQEGRAVCFVGDGINDSIALKKANVSVSLSGSTTIAMDTAQIVLMDATLEHLPLVFTLANEMDDNLRVTQALAVIPSLSIWAGVFFFNLGILGAAVIYEASLWAGMGNAFRPLLKYRVDGDIPQALIDNPN